jgi:alpha-tubulin suppressor-like RCC1 family protein
VRNMRRRLATTAFLLVTIGLVTMGPVPIGAGASPAAAGPTPPPTGQYTRGALTWGANEHAQLGDGTLERRFTPVQPVRLHDGVAHVAAGGRHTLAARSTGVVDAWGDNTEGQLGNGTTLNISLVPVRVSGLAGVIAVSAGDSHSLALRSDGTVWAWGDNSRGQLGDGSVTDRATPVPVAGLTNVVEIAAGGQFSLARRSDGSVRAWGANDRGQLGDGTAGDRLRAVAVIGLPPVMQIAAGARHALALRFDGLAFAWGENGLGELGDGTTDLRAIPVPVSILTGITHIAAGSGLTVAVSGGRPFWWGMCEPDVAYEVGDACEMVSGPGPHEVAVTAVTRVAAGASHMMALNGHGAAWTWGRNGSGQLGDGSTQDRVHAVRIYAANDAVQIDGGGQHTVASVVRPLDLDP